MAVVLALGLAAGGASADHKEFHAARSESITAKVKAVDAKTRQVTLVGEDGTETSFTASDQVRNLDKLKAGDKVTARLDQALTLWILGKDDPAPDLSVGSDVVRAKAGEKPGGMMTADVSGVATVEEIAADKKWVKLKGPRGNVVKLAVRDPKNLAGVAVGTRVGFAYSEALAVGVKPAKGKKPAPSSKPKA
jgi:Cu/Ag efflux protein CusF